MMLLYGSAQPVYYTKFPEAEGNYLTFSWPLFIILTRNDVKLTNF